MVALQFGLDPHSPVSGSEEHGRVTEQENLRYEGDRPRRMYTDERPVSKMMANLAAEREVAKEAGRGYEFSFISA